MPNRCVAVGCQKENVPSFHFPNEETHSELRKEWAKFVNRPSSNWQPSKSSVICMKHFEDRFIIYGKRRKTLNMKLNPVPSTSIYNPHSCNP